MILIIIGPAVLSSYMTSAYVVNFPPPADATPMFANPNPDWSHEGDMVDL